MRNFPKALAAYQAIEKANMGPAWTLKAQLWAGKILTEQNQLEAASQALEKVAAAAKEKYADIYNEAQIALAESYIKANKPEKFKAAEDLLKKIIETNDRDEVLAVAHNTLGDCYKAQNKVKEARLEYLRTNVLYFKAKEQDARALFSAAECCESLKEKDRADQLREELKKTYPDSQWARAL
jgi:TolA-binding protein